jgi:hypothetical protein
MSWAGGPQGGHFRVVCRYGGKHFGGMWTCHDVGAGEALLRPLGFGIETFGGTAATSEVSSKSRLCFQNRRSVTVLPYMASRHTAK